MSAPVPSPCLGVMGRPQRRARSRSRSPSVVGIDSLVSLGDLTSSAVDLHIGLAGRGSGLHIAPRQDERNVNAPVPAHSMKSALCWHDRTHADPAARGFRELVRRAVLSARQA